MVALGVSAISKIGSAYACNPRELDDWAAAISAGRLATNRGYLLNADDELRRYVIMQIMCNFELRKKDVEERFGINFDETFGFELSKMKPYVHHELVELYDASSFSRRARSSCVRSPCSSTVICANRIVRAAIPASHKHASSLCHFALKRRADTA